MSDFVRHNAVTTDFDTSDSWVILSPIEQSIKRKIEAVGVPLKDWDINIYRGVLTGYNEAFIISTEKRNEILCKCQTTEERQRTEELIRPITCCSLYSDSRILIRSFLYSCDMVFNSLGSCEYVPCPR